MDHIVIIFTIVIKLCFLTSHVKSQAEDINTNNALNTLNDPPVSNFIV